MSLIKIYFRAFLLQATWNFEKMQSLGFLYAIFPQLKILYKNELDLEQACLRHLHFFNTHPYMAMFVLGYSVRAEEEISRGAGSPRALNTFKKQIGGPLAALGDKLFWSTWRPLVGLLAVYMVICGLQPGYNYIYTGFLYAVPISFIVVYNSFHVYFRCRAFYSAYTRRTGLAQALKKINDNLLIRALPGIGLGLVLLILITAFYNWGWFKGGALVVSTIAVIFLRRKYNSLSATKLLYLVSIVGVLTNLLIRMIV